MIGPLDLIFPQPETISEIRFRNWYTARLSILVRFDDSVIFFLKIADIFFEGVFFTVFFFLGTSPA